MTKFAHPRKNYRKPKLSEDFFCNNPIKQLSAAKITYCHLVRPKMVRAISFFIRIFTGRGREERKRIKNKEGDSS